MTSFSVPTCEKFWHADFVVYEVVTLMFLTFVRSKWTLKTNFREDSVEKLHKLNHWPGDAVKQVVSTVSLYSVGAPCCGELLNGRFKQQGCPTCVGITLHLCAAVLILTSRSGTRSTFLECRKIWAYSAI